MIIYLKKIKLPIIYIYIYIYIFFFFLPIQLITIKSWVMSRKFSTDPLLNYD